MDTDPWKEALLLLSWLFFFIPGIAVLVMPRAAVIGPNNGGAPGKEAPPPPPWALVLVILAPLGLAALPGMLSWLFSSIPGIAVLVGLALMFLALSMLDGARPDDDT
jgi:hypothetical protein